MAQDPQQPPLEEYGPPPRCADCGQVFAIDPGDPMATGAAYFNHLATHERSSVS